MSRLWLTLAPLFFFPVASWVCGQDAPEDYDEEGIETLEVRLGDTERFPGQVFPFYLVVPEASSVSAGTVPDSDDFAIRYIDAASTVKDGIKTWALTFQAVPLKGGRLTLPAIPVNVDGIELWNAPTTIVVGEPKRAEEFTLDVTLSKNECYVGEPVVLRFEWSSRLSLNGVRALTLRVPPMTDPRIRSLAPLGVDPKSDGSIGLPVGGQRIIGRFREAGTEDKPLSKIVFERVLVPQQTGNFQLPPSSLLCSYFEAKEWKFRGSRYPSYFNNDFFDHDTRGEYQRLVATSAKLPLRVLPLPREGRPADFSGTIGSFSVEADTDTQVVEVLEPMTLSVKFSGHPFPQTLNPPSLREQRALSASFRVPEEQSLPSTKGGVRELIQTIRPAHDGVAAVPALRFDYFDPDTGRYGHTSSEPISIRVNAARAATAFEADFSDGTALKNEVVAGEPGLRHNRSGDALLAHQPLAPSRGGPLFWIPTLALPPLLCLGMLYWRKAREERRLHPERERARQAHRRFHRNQSSAETGDLGALRKNIDNYLCDRLGLARGATAPSELIEQVQSKGIDDGALATLTRFLEETDWADFRSADPQPEFGEDLGVDEADVVAVIDQIEQRFRAEPKTAALATPILLGLVLICSGASDLSAQAVANSETGVRSLLDQAEVLFSKATRTSLTDPEQGRTLYGESAAHFKTVLETGLSNAPLHTNLGNARFFEGDLGGAILHYHRALLRDPTDKIAREALAHARERRLDVFPLESAGIKARLARLCERIGTRRLRWGFAFGWVALWVGLYFSRAHNGLLGHRLALGGSLLALAAGITFVVWSSSEKARPLAVVVVPETMVRKGDGYLYDPAFPNPIHSGAEFREMETRGDWVHGEFPNGESGWLPMADRALVVQEE